MSTLHTNEEIVEKLEALIKVVSDNDLLDDENVDVYYRNVDRIINGFVIDDAWKALEFKGKIKELLQSSRSQTISQIKEVVSFMKQETDICEGESCEGCICAPRVNKALEYLLTRLNTLENE